MSTIEYKVGVWVSNPASILETNFQNPEEVAGVVSLFPPDYDMTLSGYVRIGNGYVTVDASNIDSIYESAVASIRQKIRERDAEHENSRNALLNLISKFESLEYKA